jgi:putative nucleotidyltransferase with HDIG domain
MPSSSALRASALRAADNLPLVSVVLNRALALFARGDDVSAGDLNKIIKEDVVITGNVLSLANSAQYGRSIQIRTLGHAIAMLGVHKTRNVLLGLTVTRFFNAVKAPAPWSSTRFNSHSLAVASLSDLIVRNVPVKDSEWAFMAGLMHDIGLPMIASGLPEQFKIIAARAKNDLQFVEFERELLGFTHFDLGAEMLARWNCPAIVQEAAQFFEVVEIDAERPLPLGAAVKAASLLADGSGISSFDVAIDDDQTTQILETLAIPFPTEFIAKFRMEYNGLQSCAA